MFYKYSIQAYAYVKCLFVGYGFYIIMKKRPSGSNDWRIFFVGVIICTLIDCNVVVVSQLF